MLRVVFMGTPEFALPTLEAVMATGHEVAAVYCQPPRRAGRGMKEKLSPVHAEALRNNLPVRTPASLRDDAVCSELASFAPDIIIVVAYGLILPREVLGIPRHGCLNVHPSLLPRWRGAAPLQRTIMAGDAETGVCVMAMEEGLDSGPVYAVERLALEPDVTAAELHDTLAQTGAGLMVQTLGAIEDGTAAAVPQSEDGITYAEKISKDEARIDWARDASDLHNHIRGLSPFPGAWCLFGDGHVRIKILRARPVARNGLPGELLDDNLTVACGHGALEILELQRHGKGVMDRETFQRGFPVPSGSRLD